MSHGFPQGGACRIPDSLMVAGVPYSTQCLVKEYDVGVDSLDAMRQAGPASELIMIIGATAADDLHKPLWILGRLFRRKGHAGAIARERFRSPKNHSLGGAFHVRFDEIYPRQFEF